MTPFIFATDLHGIEQHLKAVKKFKEFVASENTSNTLRIFGGDLWNFAALRRQAAEWEKSIRLNEDFEAGIEFLDWYRPHVFLLGNHDQRLWDAVSIERVKHSGYKAELAAKYIEQFEKFAKKLKIKVIRYNKRDVFRTEGMAFAHGFGSGENLTVKMAETYGNVMFGHGHRFESLPAIRDNRPVRGYQGGCLCRDDMDYTRAELGSLKQEQGWMHGFLDKRNPVIHEVPVINGRAFVASHIKEVVDDGSQARGGLPNSGADHTPAAGS